MAGMPSVTVHKAGSVQVAKTINVTHNSHSNSKEAGIHVNSVAVDDSTDSSSESLGNSLLSSDGALSQTFQQEEIPCGLQTPVQVTTPNDVGRTDDFLEMKSPTKESKAYFDYLHSSCKQGENESDVQEDDPTSPTQHKDFFVSHEQSLNTEHPDENSGNSFSTNGKQNSPPSSQSWTQSSPQLATPSLSADSEQTSGFYSQTTNSPCMSSGESLSSTHSTNHNTTALKFDGKHSTSMPCLTGSSAALSADTKGSKSLSLHSMDCESLVTDSWGGKSLSEDDNSLDQGNKSYLEADGGGSGDNKCDILVLEYRKTVLTGKNCPPVSLATLKVDDRLLKASRESGCFLDKSHVLVDVDWKGILEMLKSKWCVKVDVTLKENVIKKISDILTDPFLDVLHSMMRKLLCRFTIRLLRITWEDEGISLYMGHNTPNQLEECHLAPRFEAIKQVIYSIFPSQTLNTMTLEVQKLCNGSDIGCVDKPFLSRTENSDHFTDLTSNSGRSSSDHLFQSGLQTTQSLKTFGDTFISPDRRMYFQQTSHPSRDYSWQEREELEIMQTEISPQEGLPDKSFPLTDVSLEVQGCSSKAKDFTLQNSFDSIPLNRLQSLLDGKRMHDSCIRANEEGVLSALALDSLKNAMERISESILKQAEGKQQASVNNLQSSVFYLHQELQHVAETISKLTTNSKEQTNQFEAHQTQINSRLKEIELKMTGYEKECQGRSSKEDLHQQLATNNEEIQNFSHDIQEMEMKMTEHESSIQQKLFQPFKDEILQLLSVRTEEFENFKHDLKNLGTRLEEVMTIHSQEKNYSLMTKQMKESEEHHQKMFQQFKAELLWHLSEKDRELESMKHDLHLQHVHQKMKDEALLEERLMKRLDEMHFEMDERLKAMEMKDHALYETAHGAEVGVSLKDVSRTSYSSVLSETEATTTKLKGKEEMLSSNQFQSLHHLDSLQYHADIPASKSEETFLKDGTPPLLHSNSSPTLANPREKQLASFDEKDDKTQSGEDMTQVEQFLDWINIRGRLSNSSETISALKTSVNAALKEETVPAPRAKCLDTILCIDVSESVLSSAGLDVVKSTALSFVDGIEDLMEEMDLEENIAVVAVGGTARVLQHLTNDLTLVRDAIDSLDSSGGRSPFIQALMVCVAANKGRGGVVSVGGVHKLPPRIIFITDGRPTDEGQLSGPDTQSNLTQVKFSLVQLIQELMSKKHKSTPKPISWVPVGNADENFLISLASLSGGKLVKSEDIRHLCRYYKIHQTIGRVYKMLKNHPETYRDEQTLIPLITTICPDLEENEKEDILREVWDLQKHPKEEELSADDFNNVFEDEEKVKNGELLPLGTRVVRGKDWKWKNQDTEGPGTVIQHSKKDNWIYVRWDNGIHNAYRYNEEDGKMDVEETSHHPVLLPLDSRTLDFGVKVVRGPDWRFESQDGNGQGVVIRVRESDGKVKVRWDKTGLIYAYHYGAKGKEVVICAPEFPRKTSFISQDCQDRSDVPYKEHHKNTHKTIPMWKWRDDKRQWRLYDEEIAQKLENEYCKRPQGSCVIKRSGKDRRISFKVWHEKEVDGGITYDVEREMVDEDGKNDLLALELSLKIN